MAGIKIPTINELASMDIMDVYGMSTPQLKVTVSEIGKRLNKRIDRIRYDRRSSKVAIEKLDAEGGRFRTTATGYRTNKKTGKTEKYTRPMTRKELELEVKRERDFIRGKATTIRGARTYQQELDRAALGETRREYARRKYKEYQKAKKSDNRTEAVARVLGLRDDMSRDKQDALIAEAERLLKQDAGKKVKDTSRYFERAAQRAYDARVGEMWDAFHQWREEHEQYYIMGSVSGVRMQQIIEGGMLQRRSMSDEGLQEYFGDAIEHEYEASEPVRFH